MTTRDRIRPELVGPLDAFIGALGPDGLRAEADIPARRAVFEQVMGQADATLPPVPGVTREDRTVPGPQGAPEVAVRIYRPEGAPGPLPGVLYIHGGGMIIGSIAAEDRPAASLTAAVGCVTVSVEYRLAPEHPDPAPVEDCYAALAWMAAEADPLGVDAGRIAVYGASAGGGLCAGVALLARDRGTPRIAYQMAVYPMLDDRNETASSHTIVDLGVWDRAANLEGWDALLGDRAGGADVSPYAAPARAADLAGLPPTYIEVGDLDLFLDEDLAYAQRLAVAGVPLELHVYPGVYHGFEMLAAGTAISEVAVGNRTAALRTALGT